MKQRATCSRSAGSCFRPSRRLARSRGRAVSSAMRVVMRSTSGTWVSVAPMSLLASCSASAPIASWRARATDWSRCAWWIQWRSRREPIAVRQPSSSENRVGDSWPRMVSVSSRLRRVAASRPMNSLSDSTDRLFTCCRPRPCVDWA